MAFQPTDEGSSLLGAFRWNEEDLNGNSRTTLPSCFEEIEQSVASYGARLEVVIESNIDEQLEKLSGIQSQAILTRENLEITHEHKSFTTEDSCPYTEVAPPNYSECARTMRERLIEDGFQMCDRSIVRFGKQIGKGGQGTVYEASVYWPFMDKATTMAVKKFYPMLGISQGQYPLKLWSLDQCFVLKPRSFFFDDDSALCLIMPMFSGDLRSAIDAEMRNVSCESGGGGAPFTDMIAFYIIMQLALGMKGLHDLGIYHRDLKADNVLVTKRPVDEIHEVDFKNVYTCHIADFENSKDVWGTAFWRAPEVLLSLRTRVPLSENQWQAADVYSFGMTCYEVLTGEIPFHGHPFSNYDIVLDGGRPALPDHVPEPLKNIIRRCWHPDPNCRSDFGDIIEALKEADDFGLFSKRSEFDFLQTMWESPSVEASLPESHLLRLQELVQTHYAANRDAQAGHLNYAFWGSKFVATVEQFILEFGWDSYLTHPSLPFAKYVRRRTLAALLSQQFGGFATNVDVSNDTHQLLKDFGQHWPTFFLEKSEMILLARTIYNEIKKGNEQSRFEDSDNDLTLKEKLKILNGFVTDIHNVLNEASAFGSIEVILERMDPAGTNTEIGRFHHHMKFMIRRGTFLEKYRFPLRLVVGCIVLFLINRSSYCNYILFRMFGIMLTDFYEVFLGIFCPILEFQGIDSLQAGIPKYSKYFLLLRWIFSLITLFSLVRSYGFLRFLGWLFVSHCFGICTEIVLSLLLRLHEYLYLILVRVPSFFGNRAWIKED